MVVCTRVAVRSHTSFRCPGTALKEQPHPIRQWRTSHVLDVDLNSDLHRVKGKSGALWNVCRFYLYGVVMGGRTRSTFGTQNKFRNTESVEE